MLVQGVCQVREVREKSGNSICLKKSQGKVREFYLFEKSQGNVRENGCPCMHLRKFNGIFSKNFAGGGLAGLHTNLDVRNMGMDVQYFSTCYIILTIYFSLYCRDTASRSETNKGAPLKYSYGKCKHFPKHLKCILGVGVEYKARSRGKRTGMRNPQV